MASYGEALKRVRQQTESNYAAREEGGRVLQEVFTGILGQLTEDIDPANVEKPLSSMAALIPGFTDFKRIQIEKAAEAKARVDLAAITAGAPGRAMLRAEELEAGLERDRVGREVTANNAFDEQLPTLRVSENSNKEFIRAAIKNNPSLAATIVAHNKDKNLFQVFDEGVEPGISAGQKIYTDPITKRQLYSTNNKKYINLNYAHDRLGKTFRANLADSEFSPDQLRGLSFEDRKKLFGKDKFKAVLKKTVEAVTPELLQTHEIYNKVLDEKTKEITAALQRHSSLLSTRLTVQDRIVKEQRKLVEGRMGDEGLKTELRLQVTKLKALQDKQLELRLDGSFKEAVRARVHRRAFALSLLNKQEVTLDTARVNIDLAIRLTMNDQDLKDYRKELQFFYKKATDKPGTVGTSSPAASVAPAADSGRPAVLKKPVATSERVKAPVEGGT